MKKKFEKRKEEGIWEGGYENLRRFWGIGLKVELVVLVVVVRSRTVTPQDRQETPTHARRFEILAVVRSRTGGVA